LRRTLKKPTCSLFGPYQETIYSDFFCALCKSYDDYVSSGYGRRVNRDSHRFKCTANHTDFFFPTDRLIDDNISSCSSHGKSIASSVNSVASCSDRESSVVDSESMEDRSSSDVSDDEMMPSHLLQAYESMLRRKLKEQEDNFNTVIVYKKEIYLNETFRAFGRRAEYKGSKSPRSSIRAY
jgi:hypothetical protein